MHFRIEHEGDISFIHPVGKFDGGTDCEHLQMLVADMAGVGPGVPSSAKPMIR